MFTRCLCLLAVFAAAQGRAVNISNTWVLPEEGFPVFYRYFRDRISWYEADAVCQFHHANLVTVDTTAQYDAVRAYLKELDITSSIWVGLIRSNPDGEFTWTDYRGLSGDGYWSSAPDARTAPLCAAANPTADYRWEANACGGPTVASFICELPVPQWASGSEGCMVRNLPALTVLYLPESAAVQLTADCGLAGVKRVQCTGHIKRDVLLKNLSCVDDDDISTTPGVSIQGITWPITTESVVTDQDMINEATTEETVNITMNEERTTILTSSTNPPVKEYLPIAASKPIDDSDNQKLHRVYLNKQINLHLSSNNEQRNDIPQIGNDVNELIEEETAKLEDERNMQHKLLHDELAHRGNLDIFSQPTDHFVPPLVMAKAKISDDMTVLSLAEKHAQQLAEHRISDNKMPKKDLPAVSNESVVPSTTTVQETLIETTTQLHTIVQKKEDISLEESKKDVKSKLNTPKKYNEKSAYSKGKYSKTSETKLNKKEVSLNTTPFPSIVAKDIQMANTSFTSLSNNNTNTSEDNPLELTVTLQEPEKEDKYSNEDAFSKKIVSSKLQENKIVSTSTEKIETSKTTIVTTELPKNKLNFNDEIIKISLIKEDNDTGHFTVKTFDVTTKMPVSDMMSTTEKKPVFTTERDVQKYTSSNNMFDHTSVKKDIEYTTIAYTLKSLTNLKLEPHHTMEHMATSTTLNNSTEPPFLSQETTTSTLKLTTENINHSTIKNNVTESSTAGIENITVTNNTEVHDGLEFESTEEPIDDLNSPLLSAASEPLHRPPRLRRPQQTNHAKKFNPFRILG